MFENQFKGEVKSLVPGISVFKLYLSNLLPIGDFEQVT